ncbi:VRR-NUC domain-containing protein [Ruminococcus sp. YE282]|uniref:VRR-NUC domain-containing protein n=1 Tax=Ruminococcus sp. YE282 TaxID=3158780 RepID=UPI00087F4932|nr:VRR-NUC domain-containing protein [Ruminococcus bromii]
MKQYEADQQRKLFQWTTFIRAEYPEVNLMFHIPNGGSRNKLEAANLKRQGVKAGVPDLFLPVSRGGYHGLFIELKCGKNKTTAKQNEWLKNLSEQGYAVSVCYGCNEAIKKILKYLKLGEV